ncbi:MAG: dihydrofolate reductase, partial [Bacteroidales bacterium]|nr:dihydrofolate reductase [Bacteroidales bacterium]
MKKCLIVAIGENNEIGVKNALPWHLAEDLKYFKAVTKGYPVIMGRATYFSLPFRPLPGRKNIVLNLGGDPIPEVTCAYSFEEAYKEAEMTGAEKCFIMGGASVYRAALPDMDRLYITHVHTAVKDADAFFPEIEPEKWERISTSETKTDPETGYKIEFVIYERKHMNIKKELWGTT